MNGQKTESLYHAMPKAGMTKNVKSKLYHIESSKTGGQTVQIQMRWFILSHLIKIYAVCKFSYFHLWYLKN